MATALEEVVPGIRHGSAEHPDWTPEESGDEGWDRLVSWYAVATSAGVLLVDPLVSDWAALDALVAETGGCAGVVRLLHWHERDVGAAAARYGAPVMAGTGPRPDDAPEVVAADRTLHDGDEVVDGIVAIAAGRDDEIVLWLPAVEALVAGDVLLRRSDGTLRLCPESWTVRAGGMAAVRATVRAGLGDRPVAHVLVEHGPLVLGDGRLVDSLTA